MSEMQRKVVENIIELACDADAWYYSDLALYWRCLTIEHIKEMRKEAGLL